LSIWDAALPQYSSWGSFQYLGDDWPHPLCQSIWQSMIVEIHGRTSRWILDAVQPTDRLNRWDKLILTNNSDSWCHSSSFTWVCYWFNFGWREQETTLRKGIWWYQAVEPSKAAATVNLIIVQTSEAWRGHKCSGLHQPFPFGWQSPNTLG